MHLAKVVSSLLQVNCLLKLLICDCIVCCGGHDKLRSVLEVLILTLTSLVHGLTWSRSRIGRRYYNLNLTASCIVGLKSPVQHLYPCSETRQCKHRHQRAWRCGTRQQVEQHTSVFEFTAEESERSAPQGSDKCTGVLQHDRGESRFRFKACQCANGIRSDTPC